MKRLICLLYIVFFILSGCSRTPHMADTTPTTAESSTAGNTEASTEETSSVEDTAADTEPITDIPATQSSEIVCIPETTVPVASATHPPAESQETTVPAPTACLHESTVTVNNKAATQESEGYTGDVLCLNCGALLCEGDIIPKLDANMITYTSPDGVSYTVEEGTNISDYTMKLNSWSEDHPYAGIEQEVFYLCNLAREKYGLAPLTWNEDAYCFTKIRAEDCFTLYDHIRPNGEKWNSVYADHGVFLYCINGENLNQASNCTAEYIADTLLMADFIFASWMDSPGHRENILNSNYTSVSISVLWSETDSVCYAAQNFFGY